MFGSSTSPSGSSDSSPPSHGPSQDTPPAGVNRNNFPRRSHTKSRRGCRRCKQRKIKCDEVHPECGNCVKHNVSCDFKTAGAVTISAPASKRAISRLTAPRTNTAPSSSPSSSSNHASPYILEPTSWPTRSQIPDWSNQDRMLELRIFHHYNSTTYNRNYKIPIAQEFWTVVIPSLAFEHPFLMDGLLACSALHMRTRSSTDTSIVQASHRYMARSISAYAKTLRGGATRQNFDALYLTAVLIAFHTFLSRRFEPEGATANNMAMQWFQPFQGAKAVAQSAPLAIKSSAITSIFPGMRMPLSRCNHQSMECPFGYLLTGLVGHEPDYGIYRYATSHMCSVLYCRHPRFFLRFLGDAPNRLSELLKQGDPRSLAIAYAFFTLMKTVEITIWWLDGAADREITQIRKILPKAWMPMLDKTDEVVWGCIDQCEIKTLHIHAVDDQAVPLVSTWRQDRTIGVEDASMASITDSKLNIS